MKKPSPKISSRLVALWGACIAAWTVLAFAPPTQSSRSISWKITEDWAQQDGQALSGHWSLRSDQRHRLTIDEHSNSGLWDKTVKDKLDQIASDLATGSATVNTLVGIENWK
ncbi:MAG: hypothetical protein K2X47_19880, partial [Bdellovibrionales bacterium]|nr:hypothetical protein [Bdellovibrionales bacterium]